MKNIGLIQISFKRQGGVIYRGQVINQLKNDFNIESIDCSSKYFKEIKYLKIPESIFRLIFLKEKKDLWIRDFFSTAFFTNKSSGKNISLIFHVDFSGFPFIGRPALFLMEKMFFYRNLKKANAIVVISDYWRKFFLEKGFKNIYKIPCAFNLDDFNISDAEVENFKKENSLLGKPIIYIGNCQRAKGMVDVYNALKDLDVFLVSSGKKEVNIPAINLDSNYRDYLRLLKASSIAITMSKFKEGWCMTAHEAMLCKTPVIGSGLGGMEELLNAGGQIVCNDFSQLKNKVESLLNNQKEMENAGERGYSYAKNFTFDKFRQNWKNLINEV